MADLLTDFMVMILECNEMKIESHIRRRAHVCVILGLAPWNEEHFLLQALIAIETFASKVEGSTGYLPHGWADCKPLGVADAGHDRLFSWSLIPRSASW